MKVGRSRKRRRPTGTGIGAEAGDGGGSDDRARGFWFQWRSFEHGFSSVFGCKEDTVQRAC